MFEDPFDLDVRSAMALREEDKVDVWPEVKRKLPVRTAWLELLMPLAAAAAALVIARGMTTSSVKASWPINGQIVERSMASLSPHGATR